VTAALVCNDLSEFYVEEDARLRSQRYAGRAEMLKQRLEEMRGRLDDQERRFGGLRRRPLEGGTADAGADAAAFERLSSRLRVVREERMRALERREALLKQLAEADPRDAASSRLARLRQDLTARRLRLTDKHPDVLQLEAEIAALEQESGTRMANTVEAPAVSRIQEALRDVEAELPLMKREEARLTQELAAYPERLGGDAGPRAAAGPASRDYQAAQEMYGALMRRYEDAQLADSAEETLGSRLSLLDPAVAPTRATGPNRVRLLVFAFLVALAAAVAVAAAADRLDDSFRSVDDLRAFTNVPVLATVSALATPADRQRWRRRVGGTLLTAGLVLILVAAAAHHAVANGYALTSALERAQ
jgi:polysaccharide biosynthesis transport protein